MNRLSLRKNWLKLKTTLEEFVEYTLNYKGKEPKICQTCDWLDMETLVIDRLCPKTSLDTGGFFPLKGKLGGFHMHAPSTLMCWISECQSLSEAAL